MPIPVICPGCRTKLNAPDHAAGKAVRCGKCRQSIHVPTAASPKADGIMPASASPRTISREASQDRQTASAKSRRRGDDFDSDEDRPRRRREIAKSSSPLPWILAGVAIVAMVAILGVGSLLIFAFRSQPVAIVVQQPVPAVAVAPDAAVPKAAPVVLAAVDPKPVRNNWTVVFRCNDASIWGTDTNNGPDQHAVSLNRIPGDIRYLRIQECTNHASLIIPMSRDRLAKDSVQGGIGWNGTGRMEWKGRHLGVYNASWDELNPGDISFSTPAFFKGYKGWGFGHRIRKDDVQAYAWNGDAIVQTVFEIAVTNEELTPDEKRHLFGANENPPPVIAKVEVDPAPPVPAVPGPPENPAPPVAAVTPAPNGKAQVFVFDGKSRIFTPLERFAPVTLEAWFRPSASPRRRGDRIQYLIGSDIPGQYGYGLGIRYDRDLVAGLQMETMRTFHDSSASIPSGQWAHAAAVFTPNEVAIYLNGKITFKQSQRLEILGGTTFAVGKAGRDATVPYFFTGEIREIRISNGTRYTQEFTAPATFGKDASAALIYRASDVNGKKVIDLSGNGRDGELDGVLVANEDEKIAANPAVIAGGANEYEPKSKRFTITMPKGVKSEQSTRVMPIPVRPGAKLPAKVRPNLAVEISYSQQADGTKFVAASIGMPAALLREIPEDVRLEIYRDAFLNPANATIVSETEIRQGRYSGKEYLVDLPRGQMRMQLLMLGGAGCYAIVEAPSIERLATRDVDEYFESFKINE